MATRASAPPHSLQLPTEFANPFSNLHQNATSFENAHYFLQPEL
jgi:hypothetical protein